ncbi:MAG: hypothetical protein IJO52_04490, partial [Clostridia bacterium]|nr:hypothetical protein [Clostridia bacterium]
MKAKSILRALTLAFVLCALLALTTLAADSYKIITFDDMGMKMTPKVDTHTGEDTIGLKTLTDGTSAYSFTLPTNADAKTVRFDFNLHDTVSLNDYPYIKIRMRTNW